jgi:heme/copper-type cytochrome/quinol oxidase subunit 2
LVKRPVILAVVVVAILAVSGGYYINSISGTAANSQIVTVIVSAGLFGQNATLNPDAYSIHNFTVTEGQRVTIVFDNTDDGPHQLVIPAFGVDSGIVQGGQTIRVNFTPNKVGVFPFFQPNGACNYGGLTPQQGGCTGNQETSGNMTVIAP